MEGLPEANCIAVVEIPEA